MPEALTPTNNPVDPHEERRLEIALDQGVFNGAMAEAEAAGSFVGPHIEQSNDAISESVQRGHGNPTRKPRRQYGANSGYREQGIVSGTDESIRIAKEEAKNQEPVVLTEAGVAHRDKARAIARKAAYTSFLNTILDLPVTEQMARIRAWEEKHPPRN